MRTRRNYSLVNRAGGLYEIILTEVASTDLTAFGLYQPPRLRFSHTDRPSSVKKMFIIWPNKKVTLKTSLHGSGLKYPACIQCHLFTNGSRWKIWTIEGRAHWRVYVFNFSRLFQWFTKFLPCVQIALILILSVALISAPAKISQFRLHLC